MPDRSRVGLEDVAAFDNLAGAFGRAAKGKRRRPEVRAFEQNLENELEALGDAIRSLEVEVGRYHVFRIHDPKMGSKPSPRRRRSCGGRSRSSSTLGPTFSARPRG